MTGQLKTSYLQTSTREQRVHDLGEVEPLIGPNGFGSITFRDKKHSFSVTLPVRPDGYVMGEQEIKDALSFEWPKEVTEDFRLFIQIRTKELLDSLKK